VRILQFYMGYYTVDGGRISAYVCNIAERLADRIMLSLMFRVLGFAQFLISGWGSVYNCFEDVAPNPA